MVIEHAPRVASPGFFNNQEMSMGKAKLKAAKKTVKASKKK
jgi:hypothetical protein